MADSVNNQATPGQVKMFNPNLFSSPPQPASNKFNNVNLDLAAAANGFDPNTSSTNSSTFEQQWTCGANLSDNGVQENNVSGGQSNPSQNCGNNVGYDTSSTCVELGASESPKQQAQSAGDWQSAHQWQAAPEVVTSSSMIQHHFKRGESNWLSLHNTVNSQDINSTSNGGATPYQPDSAGMLSTDHQQHCQNNPHNPGPQPAVSDSYRNDIRSQDNVRPVRDDRYRRDQSRNVHRYKDDPKTQKFIRDDRHRRNQSKIHNHRGDRRSENRGRLTSRHGYPEDLYMPLSRQVSAYHSDHSYSSNGKNQEMRPYQQYQDEHSQRQQHQQESFVVGFYDQYGRYYARSQSYDSNYSHHSQPRGSTPRYDQTAENQFVREMNHSSPSSRQSGCEPSPIYPVDLGQQQEQPALQCMNETSNSSPSPTVHALEPVPAGGTPPRYTFPNVKASILPGGMLLEVQPNQPKDGQTANVLVYESPKVHGVDELKAFPGPLSRNQTHKCDVLRFCQDQVKKLNSAVGMFDKESACLLWRYLELLIRQNGIVLGTDLASLLMEEHEKAKNMPIIGSNAPMDTSNITAAHDNDLHCTITADRSMVSPVSVAALDRFRNLCLFGRKKQALEFSMKANLWEQALFLAITMGPMISASVTTRYIKSAVAKSDPLRTFYQMLSGRQPAACTMVGDEEFGDWKPHLAVILSQATERTELDKKYIEKLGDALATKGRLFASQLCYLMADCHFQDHSQKTAKLVLLGSKQSLPLQEHATNLSIQTTEVYEYAMSLAKPNYCIQSLQAHKLTYVTRLVDAGLIEKALAYCEQLSGTILQSAASYPKSLVQGVAEFGDRLQYFDRQLYEDLPDPEWLEKIRAVSRQYESGVLPFAPTSGSQTPATENTPSISEQMQNLPTGHNNQEQLHQDQCQQHQDDQATKETPTSNSDSHQESSNFVYRGLSTQTSMSSGVFPFVPTSGSQTPATETTPSISDVREPMQNLHTGHDNPEQLHQDQCQQHQDDQATKETPTSNSDSHQESSNFVYHGLSTQTSMSASDLASPPTENKPKKKAYWPGDDDEICEKTMAPAKKTGNHSKSKGLFEWLFGSSKKTSKEIKLPDDSNPTIYWDDIKKKWVDTEKSEEEEVDNSAPPPKDTELSTSRSGSHGPQPLTANRYSRGNLRGKMRYVDVLASAVAPTGADTHTQPQWKADMYNPEQQANQQMYQPQSQSEWQQPPVDASAPPPPQMQFFNPSHFQQPIVL